LLKQRAFTAIVVFTIALGIGANTAIFQLLDAVRLRMLPVRAPQELVELRLNDTKAMRGGIARSPSVTNRIWEQIRAQQHTFSSIAAWGMDTVNLAPGGEVRNARLLWVSGDFFNTLGVQPAIGRFFTSSDDQRGCGTSGVVISNAFWQHDFGGDPNIAGRKLTIADHTFPVIGVAPASFFGMEVGRSFDLALPLCAVPQVRGNNNFLDGSIWWLTVTARLAPGLSPQQATTQMQTLSSSIFASALPPNYPPASAKDFLAARLIAVPAGAGVSRLREKYEEPLWLLFGVAGSLMLIACANLANLLLARAKAREREIGIRQALGASRSRLVRQLLIESLLLAAVGGSFGVALGQVLSRALVAFLSTSSDPVFLDLTPDWRLVEFAVALAFLTSMLFALVPAIRAAHLEPNVVLKTGGRGMTASRERFNLRRALVVVQVALSLALVAGALLFSRSLGKLLAVDTGFRQEGILIATVVFQRLNLPPNQLRPFKEELLTRIRAIPGTESVGLTNTIPLRDEGGGNAWIDGLDPAQGQHTNRSRVGPAYFETLKVPVLAGREFDETDQPGAPKVAIVNEAFARRFLNGANPVGRRVWMEGGPNNPDTAFEIIGLVRDTKYRDLREEFEPIVYDASTQDAAAGPGTNLLIRSRLPQAETVASVTRVLNEINPAITVNFQAFQPMIDTTILRERLMARLSGFFGSLAMLIACGGLYGILSYGVTSRTNEIGIRMALGARARNVQWLILREALLLVIVGVGMGLPVMFAVTRLASALLFGLTPTDPPSLLLAVLLMILVALVAGYLPSRRATRIDPLVALRYE
jgi:putative ABC transport system permease protein